MDAALSKTQTEALRQRLLREQAELEARIGENGHYQLESSQRETLSELSAYDNHPGDLGTETFERGKDLALLERDAFRLERIRAALKRMETGEYGRCQACGAPIPAKRLEAMPTAEYCVAHEPRQDISHDRPIEEEILRPPFGPSRADEAGEAAFDGEDAWQAVSSWGNSDSPAFAEERDVADYSQVYLGSDENEGFVEPIENFLATDITGRKKTVVFGPAYRRYLEAQEGVPLLAPDERPNERLGESPGERSGGR